ncbi:alpha/beta fold hydrolase [Streptomyces sp. NPDC091292]|uniref:alpha/beta fold hydrolase n=1 Tax=Streptomyces sp. NPDC091292 TaxID=3365991 RepID=UPI00381201EE
MNDELLPGFARRRVDADGVGVHLRVAGEGPPVLLLHGYPQTHLIWHHVAPLLAARYTVVVSDLRGYGDSDKPASLAPDHGTYSKRAMAHDQWLAMRALGFDRFAVAGHDRGGRVGHRLALDHPEAVSALAVLDIVPTRHALRHADLDFGRGYYHWFFLAAGDGIPERLIGADPEFWVRTRMNARHHGGTPFHPAALDEYVRCFADPAAVHASCEDYRAALTIDLAHDDADAAAGRTVDCPVLALWGEHSFVGRTYDVPEVWSAYAKDVRGAALPCDHYVPEEAPAETARLLGSFFGREG